MIGFTLRATDGEVGDVKNIYFDDEKWVVRYLVIAIDGLSSGTQVLISPICVVKFDGEERLISADLTKHQVRHSPSIASDKPISRRLESIFNRYYHYPGYWIGSGLWGECSHPGSLAKVLEEWEMPLDDANVDESYKLRSVEEVRGYAVHSNTRSEGQIEDFLIDEATWAIGYLIVSQAGLLRREMRLYKPTADIRVSWSEQKIYLSRNSPSG
jgi:hypothetical protein